jgi:DNA polymerase III subunit beta
MKFTVNAGELSAALVGPCARARAANVIAILKHVRCESVGAEVRLLGHDLDSSSEATVPAEVHLHGACAIPAEPLARIVAGFHKAASIIVEIVGTDAIIRSGRSRYKLPVLDAKEMPPPLTADGGTTLKISSEDIKQLFVRGRSAISPKEPRTCLQGFYLHADAKRLCSVATNGYALMRFGTSIEPGDFKGAIIPRSAADEIAKFGKGGEIAISDRIVSFCVAGAIYSSKLVDSTYPESFHRIIGATEEHIGMAKIDRETVLECLSRLRAAGDFSETDLIDIEITNDEISISVTGAADGAEKIECESETPGFVCLRAEQLTSALEIMNGETVQFRVPNEREAFRVIDSTEPFAVNILVPCASKTNRRAEAA